MSNQKRTLTEKEVEALGPAYRLFFTKCETQALEQRAFLKAQIGADPKLPVVRKNALLQDVERFTLQLAQVRDENVGNQAQVQVVYNVEDDLFAYLNQDAAMLPVKLRGFMVGGVELTYKDTAVDNAPKTGKTRAR